MESESHYMTNRKMRMIYLSLLHELMVDMLRQLMPGKEACFEVCTGIREELP